MDLEIITLSEGRETERQIYDITSMWNLKKMLQTNLWLPKGKGRVRDKLEFGISRYKPVYIK